ncbi:MAG TPA: 1,4-dihydroxy-6-naphthoate synthase [Desulfosarcina sp.]|nr:1,4-dihydroxy-6-naphthoate synthase [Desulfosarcina sp.]
MQQRLTLGYSTCPNDTFLFYALAHDRVRCPVRFKIELADVETLNQAARTETFDISKLSFAAIGHLQDRYGLLRSGAALGRGCGPLIVARKGFRLADLDGSTIAVPGRWTTACLLLGLYLGKPPQVTPMGFEQIMPAIRSGACDAGVIIHEGRFTYPAYDLVKLLDLGEWWEETAGLPIPLGGIAIRRDHGPDTARQIEKAIAESVAYAFRHPDAPEAYVRMHAQEMAPEVVRQHIDLYVNDFTRDLGEVGEAAIRRLFELARERRVLPDGDRPLFAC